jgi:hypothetical protein
MVENVLALQEMACPLVNINRPYGWEERLAAVLKEASQRQFDPQTWNCALFARACAEAVSGRSLPTRLSRTLEHTVDRLFPRIERSQALRGDVVLADQPKPSLGVCTGSQAAFVGPEGLIEIPMSRVLIAWRVA